MNGCRWVQFVRTFGQRTVVLERKGYSRGDLPGWIAMFVSNREPLDMPSGAFAPTPGLLAERVERFLAATKINAEKATHEQAVVTTRSPLVMIPNEERDREQRIAAARDAVIAAAREYVKVGRVTWTGDLIATVHALDEAERQS